jgi:hypothetical protein
MINKPGVVAHTFRPSTQEAEAGRFLSSRPAWSTEGVPGQAGLHRETLSRKKQQQKYYNCTVILNGVIYYLRPYYSQLIKSRHFENYAFNRIWLNIPLNIAYQYYFCLISAAFPEDPVIKMSGPLVHGRPVTVNCTVPNVYPFDHLEIELLKGETTLMKKYFLEEMGIKSLETKILETTFIPTIEDTGKSLVCLARLHSGEMESEPKQRQSVQPLYVNGKCIHGADTIEYGFLYYVHLLIVNRRLPIKTSVKKTGGNNESRY